jgi:hypothetical protein
VSAWTASSSSVTSSSDELSLRTQDDYVPSDQNTSTCCFRSRVHLLRSGYPLSNACPPRCYPHYVHKRAKDGNLIYYEKLGKININTLRENGIDMPRLIR